MDADNAPLLCDLDADARTCWPDFSWWSLAMVMVTAPLLERARDSRDDFDDGKDEWGAYTDEYDPAYNITSHVEATL